MTVEEWVHIKCIGAEDLEDHWRRKTCQWSLSINAGKEVTQNAKVFLNLFLPEDHLRICNKRAVHNIVLEVSFLQRSWFAIWCSVRTELTLFIYSFYLMLLHTMAYINHSIVSVVTQKSPVHHKYYCLYSMHSWLFQLKTNFNWSTQKHISSLRDISMPNFCHISHALWILEMVALTFRK